LFFGLITNSQPSPTHLEEDQIRNLLFFVHRDDCCFMGSVEDIRIGFAPQDAALAEQD
jgi:hypothetical protein